MAEPHPAGEHGEPALHELAPGVFAYVQPDGTWWVNNAGAVVAAGQTLVIDTCATAARTRRFLGSLAGATGGSPVRIAVNTHEHGDHTYGNSLLPNEALLIGHENMRARLLVDPVIDACPPLWDPVPDWGGVGRRVPDLTISRDVTIHLGGVRVEVLHPGYAAHTTGDLAVWLPDQQVLYSGDLIFHGLTPLVVAGSIEGALRSLEWLWSFRPEQLVPGHGPIVPARELDRVLGEHERYYRLVLDRAEAGRRAGRSPLEVARETELGEFAAWADSERLVLNLHRAYADAESGDVDLALAFADAIAWNAGAPLSTRVGSI
ncbi:MAG TPA: MBL fold metallo-hydrolase [Acidimicrobiales bacterium]|nr:MBL fold metallo-hydrolase [Acidimicrobiales bacterium]